MTIGDLCEFKIKFPDADFWLVRKGSESIVGKPVKEYNPEHIGVKVLRTDLINSQYLYYVFMHLQQSGKFVNLSHGTLRLKNISISDIKKIPVG
jgi:restriction endonuclease S subunit